MTHGINRRKSVCVDRLAEFNKNKKIKTKISDIECNKKCNIFVLRFTLL